MDTFASIFEELSKLYDEENIEEACTKKEALNEEEEVDIEIVDDEAPIEEIPAEDEPRQVILECDKCGALVIKDEADLAIDEESDLANVEDECQFCEEAAGYKIVGTVLPYETTEVVPEEADIEEEEVFEESAEAINEDVADTFRKVFDKPASSETQQKWEDEITDLQLALEKETDENKKRRIEKRIKQLEDKFAQQRDYEKRHEDEDLEELLDVSVPVNVTANGNDVAVGGLTK